MVEMGRATVVGLEATTVRSLALEYPIEEWFINEPYSTIPAKMQEEVKEYVVNHKAPGAFLRAIIKNDLQAATARAVDGAELRSYVQLLYNKAPASCHGSVQAYADWIVPDEPDDDESSLAVLLDFYPQIPQRMLEALARYIFDRIPTGDFLRAVLENDLRRAVGYADAENLALLSAYAQIAHAFALHGAAGSPAAVQKWLAGG